jgi:beta-lactamase class A
LQARDMIKDVIGSRKGTFSVTAKDLVTGEIIGYNSELLMPTASTFKVFVLWELMRQVEQGRIKLSDMHTYAPEDFCPGSGIISMLTPGLQISVRDLALLMIIVSDNVATDILLGKVGIDNLARTLAELGCKETSIPNGCKRILADAVGIKTERPTKEELLRAMQLMKEDKFDYKSTAFAHNRANVVTTGPEIISVLERFHKKDGLSAESCDIAMGILAQQQHRQRIPGLLPSTAKTYSKTGTLRTIANDAGLVYPENGHPYAIAIYTHQEEPVDLVDVLARISRCVYDYIVSKP